MAGVWITELEPAIITEELLETEALKGYCETTEEALRIVNEEGFDFSDVEELKLDFKNILRLTNFVKFSFLRKLHLSNNRIEIIDCLDNLKNLIYLDLSFNNIMKITGLEKLVNLEDLSLTKNKIEKVENLDQLKKLQVLSLKDNFIADDEYLTYMNKFKSLKAFSLIGCPISKEKFYVLKTIAFIPNLVYLDYRIVTSEQRQLAKKEFTQCVIDFEESKALRKLAQAYALLQKKLELKEAFVYNLHDFRFFNILLAEDLTGGLALRFSNLEESFVKMREKFNDICNEWVSMSLRNSEKRKEEMTLFNTCVEDLLAKNLERSRKEVFDFSIYKERFLMALSMQVDNFEVLENIKTSFKKKVTTLWKKLISFEVPLNEKIISVSIMLMTELTTLIEFGSESGKNFAKQLETVEEEYREIVYEFYSDWNTHTTEEKKQLLKINATSKLKKPRMYKFLQKNEDAMFDYLSSYHDHRNQTIKNELEMYISNLNSWVTDTIFNLRENEVERHRKRLIEIQCYCEEAKREFYKTYVYLKYVLNTTLT